MLEPNEMPERVAAFLARHEPGVHEVEVTSYEVMTGGYSRLLAKADVRWVREGRIEERAFVLRGDPPVDRQLIVTDRSVEHDVLKTVEAHVPTAKVHSFDPTGEHLATPALVLEHLTATSLLVYMANQDDNAHVAVPLAETAAAFHTIPLADLPPSLERPKDWSTYLDGRIAQWREAAIEHGESLPIMRYVAAWLAAHRPAAVDLALIHGDFQSANLMWDGEGQIVVLDWELAQIGDPREDLGYFKAVAQAAGPDVIGLDEAAFCSRYRELTGMDEEQLNPAVIAYFLVLGVIGTVRQLLRGGDAYARGDNHLLASAFNLNAVQFGQSMWLQFTEQLEAAFTATGGAS